MEFSESDDELSSGSDSNDQSEMSVVDEVMFNIENMKLESEAESGEKKKFKKSVTWTLKKLLHFYSTLIEDIAQCAFEDITKLFVDGNIFIVCGDSLLMSAMKNNYCVLNGGQTLHLVYLCERLIQLFQRKGAMLEIVFFDIWNETLINQPFMLARSVLITHIRKNTQFNIHYFTAAWDSKFCKFVDVCKPSFLLLDLDIQSMFQKIEPSVNMDLVNLVLYSQVLFTSALNLTCVSMEEVILGVSTMNAFVVEPYPILMQRITRSIGDLKTVMASSIRKQTETQCHKQLNCGSFGEEVQVRHIVTVMAAAWYIIEENNISSEHWVRAFLIYSAVMEVLPLANRACSLPVKCSSHCSNFIRKILFYMNYALTHLPDGSQNYKQVADLWHGNLFLNVLVSLTEGVTNLGIQTTKVYCGLIREVRKASGKTLNAFPIVVKQDMKCHPAIKHEEIVQPVSSSFETSLERLVTASCHLSREFCDEIMHEVYQQTREYDDRINKYIDRESRFTEVHHWHSKKPLSDEPYFIKDNKMKPKDRKENYFVNLERNKLARFMTYYGRNLEGRQIAPKVITTNDKTRAASKTKKCSQKTLKYREDNLNRKKETAKEFDKNLLKDFKKVYKQLKLEGKYSSALERAKTLKKKFSDVECIQRILVYIAKICYLIWMGECRLKTKLDREVTSVKELLITLREIHKGSKDHELPLPDSVQKDIGKWLGKLGFKELALLWGLPCPEQECTDFEVGLSWVRFQLLHLGGNLERVTEGKPDNRVNFIPDPWQKRLFDIIDRRESAVIVAPTSSGKTYACYYCMESVLREDDEAVVVYISPTKALVNQVAATIHSRFEKNLPDGKSIYGVFTRDYRTNDMSCQILVTVPECLELLLLSPRRQTWVHKVRYVIFDEIHCLAGTAGGISWETGLLMIRCPFLALSATIGNPEMLHNWLQETEKYKQMRDVLDGCERKSYKVHLVTSSERHSDLKKYIYSVNGGMIHIHPYAYIDKSVIKEHKGIPNHVLLAPDEALQLYCAMEAASEMDSSVLIYKPETYFSSKCFLTRSDVRDYEKCLQSLMNKWAFKDWSTYKGVIANLQLSMQPLEAHECGYHFIVKNFINFIQELKNRQMFPSIFFRYDKSNLDYLFMKFVRYCRALKCKPSKPSRQCRTVELADKKEKEREKKFLCKLTGNSESASDIATRAIDFKVKIRQTKKLVYLGLLEKSSFGSIQNIGIADNDDVEYIEDRLNSLGHKKNDPFPSGLRNGMGKHHSAMSVKEKSAVEMLFRMKILNVVLATGTLALGIHMPCKTVVIGGDSLYLDTLTYHQISGRAGRRGFDTEGNVIFFGVPERRIKTMLTGRFPKMIGNFPLTVSFVLRLMLLTSDVTERHVPDEESRTKAVSRALTFLNCCLVYQYLPELKDQMKHFFAFSSQLLILQGLLDDTGKPQKLCGLITHLHYHEPGNLVLAYLLRSGALRRLCENKEQNSTYDVERNLVLLLSHLFARIPLHNSYADRKFDNSKVLLPELPPDVKADVEKYNEEVKFIYDHYFRCVANHFSGKFEEDNILPLSKVCFEPLSPFVPELEDSNLEATLVTENVPRKICSHFAALSGLGDKNLYSQTNVISDIRHEVFTDVKVVPLLDCSVELNAYAWDFYNHGILVSIIKDNGIKTGIAYDLLNDFRLMLRTVYMCVTDLGVGPEDDPVIRTIKNVSVRFTELFMRAFGHHKGL